MSFLDRVRGKIILSVIFGVLVIAGLGLFTDLGNLGKSLSAFNWALIPAILGLTLFNYVLRFVKWDYYVHLVSDRPVSKQDSALVFYSGFTMVMTPGKVGELLKAYLLRQVNGTPLMVSSPIVIAERMSDGIAMMLLAVVGFALLLIFGGATGAADFFWPILALVLVGYAAIIIVARNRALADRIFTWLERYQFIAKRMHNIRALFESSNRLLSPRALFIASSIGFVSWAGECLAFFLVMLGLGFAPSWNLVFIVTFILGATSIAGAASGLPGGLGVADAGIAGLLIVLVAPPFVTTTISRDTAIAATLLIRIATLWFGVLVGLVFMLLFHLKFGKVGAIDDGEAGGTAGGSDAAKLEPMTSASGSGQQVG